MAFICGGLKILKFCSGAQVQGIFRPRRSGFKGLIIVKEFGQLQCIVGYSGRSLFRKKA